MSNANNLRGHHVHSLELCAMNNCAQLHAKIVRAADFSEVMRLVRDFGYIYTKAQRDHFEENWPQYAEEYLREGGEA